MLCVSLAIQVLPLGTGTSLTQVNAAIGVIRRSSAAYEVGPLETVMAGSDARELADIALRSHSATLEAGAHSIQTNVRLLKSVAGLLGMDEKTAPFQNLAK